MDKQGIVNYVMNNLPNVNKTVLKSLLVALDEGEALNINKILDYVGYTEYNTNRAVLNTLLMSEEVPLVGHAYARYNSEDKTLYFFRDEEGKYEERQVIGNETFFTQVEDYARNPAWPDPEGERGKECEKIVFEDVIRPLTCRCFFNSFEKLEEIQNIEKLDTSHATRTDAMFEYASSLQEIDVSSFNTSNVTNMTAMFHATNATEIKLGNLDTSNVTTMNNMFGVTNVSELDLNSFNTSKVTNMEDMFINSSVETIYVGPNFIVSNVVSSYSMFGGCGNLVGGAGTILDANHTGKEYARIDNPPDEPGYFTAK